MHVQNDLQQTTELTKEQLEVVEKLTIKFIKLGLTVKLVKPVSVGPIVSIYRFEPSGTTKVNQMEALADDMALALGVEDVLIKRMPGETSVGVFVPNKERKLISFMDVMTHMWHDRGKGVPLALGVDHLGNFFHEDLTQLPHLLISGSTGSGKSTLLSSLVASVVYCENPNRVQFVLSDTKNVEFGHFIGAPHLLFEPATSVYQTLERLDWCIDEMDDRLKLIGKAGFRNISEYNASLTQQQDKSKLLPFIVIIIDELADLMMFKGEKRGESKIASDKIGTIVQKSRAAGIYFIAATQRPSVNVVAGSIKANFPARLTFRLPSEVDSRTVISTGGAEHLLSQGDMLYVSPNRPGLARLHAPFARISDIKAVVDAASRKQYD